MIRQLKGFVVVGVAWITILPTLGQGTVFVKNIDEADSQGVFEAKRSVMAMPMGVMGVVVGVAAGVPVKMAMAIFSESKRMCRTLHDDFGGEKSLVNVVLVGALGIPYGITSGVILGAVRGIERGLKDGYRRPFSMESIGVRESED